MQLIFAKKNGAAATGFQCLAAACVDFGFGPVSAAALGQASIGRVGAPSAESNAWHCEEEGQEPASMGRSPRRGRVHAEQGEVGEVPARDMQSLYSARLILALLLLLPQDV